MKKILIFLFSILISFNSYGEWVEVSSQDDGTNFYLDFDSIRKGSEYIYWWDLTNYPKPDSGVTSIKVYHQGDCDIFRIKHLNVIFYKQPMSKGKGDSYTPETDEWQYPEPKTTASSILERVCNYLN
jgi:hypothetical protein